MSVTRQHAEDMRKASEIALKLGLELEALRARHERLRKAAENFLGEYQETTNVNLLDAYEMALRAAMAEEGK